ncbi:hypothetical protein [Clostridium sp. CF012]|nr:hypothetical protein [Clostridium sp. CF012]MBU3144898.1 hypothetical protein [Clostridium sp. CF012]
MKHAIVVGKFFNKEQTNIYVTESLKLADALVIAPKYKSSHNFNVSLIFF